MFLAHAVLCGDVRLVRNLKQDPKGDPSIKEGDVLRMGCNNSNTEVIRPLLAHPTIDASVRKNYCLSMAVSMREIELVKLFLSKVSDPNVHCWDKPLVALAVDNGHREVLQLLLLDSKINTSVKNNKAIRLAYKKSPRNSWIDY